MICAEIRSRFRLDRGLLACEALPILGVGEELLESAEHLATGLAASRRSTASQRSRMCCNTICSGHSWISVLSVCAAPGR